MADLNMLCREPRGFPGIPDDDCEEPSLAKDVDTDLEVGCTG